MLDLGCGTGAIALTLARARRRATVWAVDVNERARELCAANAAANGMTNVLVAAPDDVPADVRFDVIWSNPPIRIGKAALHELLLTWLARLTADGRAVLVVQKHLGADSLQRWLDRRGLADHPPRLAKGYRLLDVTATSLPRCVSRPIRIGCAVSGAAGSTSTRRREPFGRGAAMSARPSSSHVGGPDEVTASSAARRRRRRRRSRSASATASLPGPLTGGERGERGQVEQPAALRSARQPAGSASSAAWTTSWRGRNVCTSSRPPRCRGPTSRAPAHEQRHRLLGGPVARRQQLGVEVEERDDVGAADPVQHGLGADVHAGDGGGPSSAPVTATTGRPAAASSSSRSRVTPGRRLANARAPHAWHTAGRVVPQRRQASVPSSASPTAASQRSQRASDRQVRQASMRARPGVLCTHTTVRSASRRWAISGDVTSDVFHGSSRGAVDDLDDRPAGALVVDRRAPQPAPDRGQRRRPSGTATRAAPARRPRRARSTSDVAGVPRRAALLLQRLVVLVDDDDRGEVRGTAPTPRPGRR